MHNSSTNKFQNYLPFQLRIFLKNVILTYSQTSVVPYHHLHDAWKDT